MRGRNLSLVLESVHVFSERRLQGEMQSGVVEEQTIGPSTCALDFKGK